MARPWFRMYREMLGSPKIQRLKPEHFKAWVNILCCTDDDGTLPQIDDLAFMLRMSEDKAAECITVLTRSGLLDNRDGNFYAHDWTDHQYASDGDSYSAEKQKRYRERKRANGNALRNEDGNELPESDDAVTKTLSPRTDTDTDTEKKEDTRKRVTVTEDPKPTDPETPGWPRQPDLQIAVQFWNEFAEGSGLPKVSGLSGERQKHLTARLKEIGSLGEWFSSVKAIKEQPFLMGKNDRNWRANFDWFLKPTNFSKVIENTYERGHANGRA